MKLKKISIAVGFLLTIAVTWQGSIFFRKPDTVEHHYPTITDAHSDRLFDKGWLPPIIPASSYNITTHNNLDLNTSVGDFSFQKEDLPLFLTSLLPLQLSSKTLKPIATNNGFSISPLKVTPVATISRAQP